MFVSFQAVRSGQNADHDQYEREDLAAQAAHKQDERHLEYGGGEESLAGAFPARLAFEQVGWCVRRYRQRRRFVSRQGPILGYLEL